MGWEWLPTVVNTVFSVLEVAAVAGVASVCPPLAPVVGGCLAISGNLVAQEVTKAVDGEQPLGYAQGIYAQQLSYLQDYAQSNSENILINQQILMDIKGMIDSNAEQNREMMRGMKKSLEKFEHNVNKNFDALKDFMLEKDFDEKTQMPINMMWNYMKNASSSMTKYKVDLFLNYYDVKGSAKLIFEEFIEKLKHTHTNPISSALENNVGNSSEIAKNFMHLISQMTVKVYAIEGFYHGLTTTNNNGSAEYMKEFSAHMESMIAQLRDFFINYKLPQDKYWPDLVHKTTYNENSGDDIQVIANGIKDQLDRIYTRDIFTIHVFNCPQDDCIVYDPLPDSTVVQNEESPLMYKDINAETNIYAIVLRSENYRVITESDKVRLDTAYIAHYLWSPNWAGDKCNEDTWGDLGKAFEDIFNDEKIRPHGFVACGVPGKIEQRLTNKTAVIFSEEQQSTVDNDFYFGLSWP